MTAVFDATAGVSARCFGGFGEREAGLGSTVRLGTARKVMMTAFAVSMLSAVLFSAALAPRMPRFIFSPWAKFCGKGRDAQANQTCYTGGDAHTEAGQPLVGAALIEPEGEAKKLFRITLPNPLLLEYGARVIVDQQPPMTAPFFTCVAKGCMADYEATPDLIGKLKHGRTLTIQAINLAGAALSFPLPLADFAKANEGPATDPKVLEEQQAQQGEKLQDEKIQDEVEKRADEVLKRLEGQDHVAPTPSH